MRQFMHGLKTRRERAKSILFSIVFALLFPMVYWAVFSQWVTHKPIDWRQVLGSFLFCLVVAMMNLSQIFGTGSKNLAQIHHCNNQTEEKGTKNLPPIDWLVCDPLAEYSPVDHREKQSKND